MLYKAYPQASEGELSMRLAKLVRRETCAAIAEEWDVGPYLVMGQGEARAGGRKKAAILSDICESLIGAVFLDGGFEAAKDLVQRSWRARMDADLEPERDAKTAVQEWRRPARSPRRATSRSSGAAPRTRRSSSCRWNSRVSSPSAARRVPNARPSRPRRRLSSTDGRTHDRHPDAASWR